MAGEFQAAMLASRVEKPPSDSVANLPISVSIGSVVVDDPKGAHPRPIDEILAAADTALHEAKSAGRDQVAEPLVLSV